jgi:hypothetical protein
MLIGKVWGKVWENDDQPSIIHFFGLSHKPADHPNASPGASEQRLSHFEETLPGAERKLRPEGEHTNCPEIDTSTFVGLV